MKAKRSDVKPVGSEEALYSKLKMPLRTPEEQFVSNIVSSTKCMKDSESMQRMLADALVRELKKAGHPLNSLLKMWGNL